MDKKLFSSSIIKSAVHETGKLALAVFHSLYMLSNLKNLHAHESHSAGNLCHVICIIMFFAFYVTSFTTLSNDSKQYVVQNVMSECNSLKNL